MPNTIIIKNSSTVSDVPTAGQLEQGELAINLLDEKLYSKNSSNVVFEIGAGGGADLAADETVTGTWTFDGPVTGSDFGTGGKVKDGTDVSRPIGFNVMPIYEIDVDDTFDLAHSGMLWHRDAGTAVNFTCNNDSTIPVGATYVVHNEGTDSIEITQGTANVQFINAGTAPTAGSVTVDQGGIVTVYKYSDTEFWVWGAKSTSIVPDIVEDLSDVSITSKALGDILRWNGSNWVDYADSNYSSSGHTHTLSSGATDVAATPTELNLLDISGRAPTAGWALIADSSTTASWQAIPGGITTLAGLSDTNITTPADGSLLIYDTGTATWRDFIMSGDASMNDSGVVIVANDSHTHDTIYPRYNTTETISENWTFTKARNGVTPTFELNSTNPQFFFYETDAAVGEKCWMFGMASGDIYLRTMTDGRVNDTDVLHIVNTAGAASSLTWTVGTSFIDGILDVSGNSVLNTAQVEGQLRLGTGNSADDDVLIWFDIDRSWSFRAQGIDSSCRLELRSEQDKWFLITDALGATMHQFTHLGDYTATGAVNASAAALTGALTINTTGSHIKIDDTDDVGARYGLIERNGGAFNMYYRDDASVWKLMFQSSDSGAGKLYYDGSQKLITASDGIDVTGDVGGTTIGGITQANLVDKSATEVISGSWDYDLPPQMAYGIGGDYSTHGASTAFGATIWAIDTSWKGGISGDNSAPTNVYGIRWNRGSSSHTSAEIGEGLYVYTAGNLEAGMGTLGIYSAGALQVDGNADFGAGIDVTGNITVTGTVDGKDVSTLTSNAGTVTAVNNGNGMNFTNITGSGTVTLGTPGSITDTSTNAVQTSSHTHAVSHTGTGSFAMQASPTFTTKITSDKVFLNETSAATTDVAGDGQIWVKNNVPNDLWFTNDAGVDYPVGYAAYRKSSINVIDNINQTLNMTTDSVADAMVGGAWIKTNTTAYTLTLEPSTDTEFPVGSQIAIWNRGASGNMTVTEGSGTTLYVLDGSTSTDAAGSATVGPGGYATLIRESTTVYLLMGAGVTP